VLGALAKLGLSDMLEKLDRASSALGGERDEVIELGGGVREAGGICPSARMHLTRRDTLRAFRRRAIVAAKPASVGVPWRSSCRSDH
jgi:hypothetical protein